MLVAQALRDRRDGTPKRKSWRDAQCFNGVALAVDALAGGRKLVVVGERHGDDQGLLEDYPAARRRHRGPPRTRLTHFAVGTHIVLMPIVIRPATLAFDPSGTPFSEKFGDVYHSAESGPDQARHVFLHGNALPPRWAGTHVYTILETGFGLGLNFMATCAAWRSDPKRCRQLHFVSVERHPFVREDLVTLHARYPEFSGESAAICAAWPPAIAGVHRLHLDDGRITLTLMFADVIDALRDLRLGADAFYLDGFAPDRNPQMWSPAVMKGLARLARPGAVGRGLIGDGVRCGERLGHRLVLGGEVDEQASL